MKRAGRISFILLAVIVLVAAAIVVFFFAGGDSPSTVATKFMSALKARDAATLTDLTYMSGVGKDEIRKKWDYTLDVTKHYRWYYTFARATEATDEEAAVRFDFVKNAANAGSYPEPFELPLVKEGGRWLVDVRAIARDKYPALPK